MQEEQMMLSIHLELFAKLAAQGRITIRYTNTEMELWKQLRSAGLCTIFETDRSDTAVIHSTAKGDCLARQFVESMQNELYSCSPVVSDDPLYEQAKKIVITNQKAHAVLLQRMLVIGYIRADNLLESLEQNKIVSKPDCNGYRSVLATTE